MSWTWHGLTAVERFERKFSPEPNSGCWIWTERLKRDGYGQFKYLGMMQQAHRVAWMLYRGDIPDGKSVLHKCDNPWCVNPNHLFLGTQLDNMRDAANKGRINSIAGRTAILERRRAVTACSRGHERILYWNYKLRRCRACAREGMREKRKICGVISRPSRWLNPS